MYLIEITYVKWSYTIFLTWSCVLARGFFKIMIVLLKPVSKISSCLRPPRQSPRTPKKAILVIMKSWKVLDRVTQYQALVTIFLLPPWITILPTQQRCSSSKLKKSWKYYLNIIETPFNIFGKHFHRTKLIWPNILF